MPTDATTRQFLAAVQDLDVPPRQILQQLGRTLRGDVGGRSLPLPVPAEIASPWLLGHVREALHDDPGRTALGAWFTPTWLVRQLLERVRMPSPGTVLDPSCGGGAFLLAAHERFPAAHLVGTDIDPLAVETTQLALDLAGSTSHTITVADGLADARPEPVDLVVGNPPFLSQLRAGTARDAERRTALQELFGTLARGYVDEAALFLLHAVTHRVGDLGEVMMVLPEALLGTESAGPLRQAIDRVADVEVAWRDHSKAFPGTPTCALRVTRRGLVSADRGTARPTDNRPTPSWSPLLLADSTDGIDDAALVGRAAAGLAIGTIGTATADFREAYYLLADHVEEGPKDPSPEYPRIVPVGLIDPAHLRWGETSVRFAKKRWERPVAIGLPTAFVDRRLGPKILVATQTKVLEVLVDAAGVLLPSTPVITLRTDHLWHIGAALTSPVLTRLAMIRHGGAGRSRGALKLSAKQVLRLPLPATADSSDRGAAWDAAARGFRDAHQTTDAIERRWLLALCGEQMMTAYGVDQPSLLAWWSDRLPERTRRR